MEIEVSVLGNTKWHMGHGLKLAILAPIVENRYRIPYVIVVV